MSARAILDIDHAHRKAGVTDDLYPLQSLTAKPWDFSSPTLVPIRDDELFPSQPSLCNNITDFQRAFCAAYPLLKDIKLDNVLVAGGAIGKIVRPWVGDHQQQKSPDLDLFLYGLKTKEDYESRMRVLVSDIYNKLKLYPEQCNRVSIANLLWKHFMLQRKDNRAEKAEKAAKEEKGGKWGKKSTSSGPTVYVLDAEQAKRFLSLDQSKSSKDDDDEDEKEKQKHDRKKGSDAKSTLDINQKMDTQMKHNPFLKLYQMDSDTHPLGFAAKQPLFQLSGPASNDVKIRKYFNPTPEKKEWQETHKYIAQVLSEIKYEWNRQTRRMHMVQPASLIDFLQHSSQKLLSYDVPAISQTRGPNALTLVCGLGEVNVVQIQIIFRCYQSVSEVLHGFDMGPSAIGFDGQNVWLTSLGKFAYERGCTIVDPARRSTTYELRLVKYFRRGFDLICLDLDDTRLHALSRCNLMSKMYQAVSLPKLPFVMASKEGNRVTVANFMLSDGAYLENTTNKRLGASPTRIPSVSNSNKTLFVKALQATANATSDYGAPSYTVRPPKLHPRVRRALCRMKRGRCNDVADEHKYARNDERSTNVPAEEQTSATLRLCLSNIERLLHKGRAIEDDEGGQMAVANVHDKKDEAKREHKEHQGLMRDSGKPEQQLFFASDEYTMDGWIGKDAHPVLSVEMIQHAYKELLNNLQESGIIETLKTLRRFITVQSLETITQELTKLITNPLQSLTVTDTDGLVSSRQMCIKQYLRTLINKQTQFTIDLFLALPKGIPIPWRMNNPQSQLPLNGSFHPVECSEKEWYGFLLRA